MEDIKFTLKPDIPDDRDYLFKSSLSEDQVSGKRNLINLMPPTYYQGYLGSCTGFGIAKGLREFLSIRDWSEHVPMSALWFYWQERNLEGTVDQDAGAYIRDGMKVLANLGCVPESEYPYYVDRFRDTPPDSLLESAAKYKIYEYHRIYDVNDIRHSIAMYQPVVFGALLYESFYQANNNGGFVPMPNTDIENVLGGHCMLVIGYDDERQSFIVRNSWGSNWADNGYCYIPYDWFRLYAWDMWTAQDVVRTKSDGTEW
jgi:C1A family cysteine protease